MATSTRYDFSVLKRKGRKIPKRMGHLSDVVRRVRKIPKRNQPNQAWPKTIATDRTWKGRTGVGTLPNLMPFLLIAEYISWSVFNATEGIK